MSITIKDKELVAIRTKLSVYFDEVNLIEEDNSNFRLICQDRVRNDYVDYSVWFNVKKKKKNIKFFMEQLLQHIQKFIDFKENKSLQKSLFDDFEDMQVSESKYDSLSFLDCLTSIDFNRDTLDFTKFLPSNEELKQIAMICIETGEKTKNETKKELIKEGKKPHYKYLEISNFRIDNFSFDWTNYYDYVQADGALSDFGLIDRVLHCLRIELVPYTSLHHYHIDLSNSVWEMEEEVRFRFYFDYKRINGAYENEEPFLPKYDFFYHDDFIQFCREVFKVPKREPLEDKEVLKEYGIAFLTDHNKLEEEAVIKLCNSSKNYKEFKSKVLEALNFDSKNYSFSGAGFTIEDGYSIGYEYDFSNPKVTIRQKIDYCKMYGRAIDEKKICEYSEDYIYTYQLEGNNFYEEMYRLINDKPTFRQQTLF